MKLDQDTLMRLIRQHFNEEGQRVLTFTRWKDGIDVQYPTYAIEAFAESVLKQSGHLEIFNMKVVVDQCVDPGTIEFRHADGRIDRFKLAR